MRYADHVARDAETIARLARGTDLGAPVPTCPGWTLRELVGHLSAVHRWAAAVVRTGRPTGYAEDFPASGLPDWFDEGAADLLDAMAAADPDRPCWSFDRPADRTAFWLRRQAHETAVHRIDAQRAAGEPGRYDDDLGADGVAEVCDVMYPRQVRLGRMRPLQLPVVLVDGARGRWTIGPDGPVHATVTGPAGDLLLLLWHRLPTGARPVELTGDQATIHRVLTEPVTP